ncbi:MAG: hypothetical protein E7354_01050 [Clostridiales bacterium]|nr:hypothetical protein [Clostridiales bacterium]
MGKNELKFLANLAKQRLMQKDYNNVKEMTKNRASSYFLQNAKALKKLKAETNYVTINESIDVGFVETVRRLISEDCYNPLGILCDRDYFNSLSSSEKEFYILNLSEKYNRVKDKLLCG